MDTSARPALQVEPSDSRGVVGRPARDERLIEAVGPIEGGEGRVVALVAAPNLAGDEDLVPLEPRPAHALADVRLILRGLSVPQP